MEFKHYRSYLSEVRVVVPPHVAAEGSMLSHIEGVVLMLAEQHMGIRRLSAGGGVALAMLVAECVRSGLFPGLEVLDLSSSYLMDEEAEGIVQALSGGYCRSLKELSLCVNVKALEGITDTMAKGACPSLRKFGNAKATMGIDGASILAALLQSGAVPHLEEVGLSMTGLGNEGIKVIAAALQLGECPNLGVLDLAACNIGADGAVYIRDLLRSRACPKLNTLVLSSNIKLGDEGVAHISDAIGASCCPALKRLELQETGMSAAGGRSLAQALISSSSSSTKTFTCPKLEYLALCSNNNIGDEAVADIVSALRSCDKLRHLMLTATGIAEKAGLALVQALVDSSWLDFAGLGLQNQEQDVLLQAAEMVGACAINRRLEELMVVEMDHAKEGKVMARSVHNRLKQVEEGFREVVAWGNSER